LLETATAVLLSMAKEADVHEELVAPMANLKLNENMDDSEFESRPEDAMNESTAGYPSQGPASLMKCWKMKMKTRKGSQSSPPIASAVGSLGSK
jgi:hypothetical protein